MIKLGWVSKFILMAATFYCTELHAVTIVTDAGRRIETNKVAHIERQFDSQLYKKFTNEMAMTKSIPGPRVILINSPGGIVELGSKMIKLIQAEKDAGVEVVCVVENTAHSMAFNTLTQCTTRLSTPNAMMLVHKIYGYDMGTPNAKNLRKMADELDKDDEPFRQANSKAMGLSLEDYDSYADKETTWSAKTLLKKHYLHDFCRIQK